MANKPKISGTVGTKKLPKVSRIPYSPQLLTWSYSMFDEVGPFGWSVLSDHQKFYEVWKRKKAFEGMTFAELKKTRSHPIPIIKLSKDARDRINDLKLDDFETLFSLRINSTNRIWCIQDGSIMRVLWWDPDHKVYPSKLRNT